MDLRNQAGWLSAGVVRSAGRTTLYSRRQNVLNQKFHYVATALKDLPDETVIDGELVALGPDGRPDFNLLQNFRSAESRIVYCPFDILVHKQRNLTQLPLSERRAILNSVIETWRARRPLRVVGPVSSGNAEIRQKSWTGGCCCEALRQRLPAWPADRALEQVSD
jgi:ATP-dependent DNA ligase